MKFGANSNLTFIYSTGPNYIFVRFPSVGAGPYQPVNNLAGPIYFLGTAEDKPEEDLQAQYLPIFNNIGGKMVPFEKSYQGEIGVFSILLNKFSHTILSMMQAMPKNGTDAIPAGQENYLSRGTLVQANGVGYELWRANGFFGELNATAYPDLPPGRYYPCCHNTRILVANEGLPDEKILLMAEPQNVYNAADGSFFLYSEDPARFAGLPNPL